MCIDLHINLYGCGFLFNLVEIISFQDCLACLLASIDSIRKHFSRFSQKSKCILLSNLLVSLEETKSSSRQQNMFRITNVATEVCSPTSQITFLHVEWPFPLFAPALLHSLPTMAVSQNEEREMAKYSLPKYVYAIMFFQRTGASLLIGTAVYFLTMPPRLRRIPMIPAGNAF